MHRRRKTSEQGEVWTVDRYRESGRFVATPRGTLFVMDQGQGSPVLFLHGIPSYSFLWRDVLPLVTQDHRAVAPDLPGFGFSEKNAGWDYSVRSQADAIESLLRQLGIDRVAIVCHDFGALVAAELISRASQAVTRLIVLNTSIRRDSWGGGSSPLSLLRIPIAGELAMALSRRWMLKLAMRVYVNRENRLSPDVMRLYWWPFENGFKETLLNLSRNRAATGGDFERWRAALAQLDAPCLIIWGQDDPTFTLAEANDVATVLPNARIEIMEHANHFVPEDRPLATGRMINAFTSGAL